MHDAERFGDHGESAFQIPVRLPGGSWSVYSPFLVLGSGGDVAAVRELYDQPKKEGEGALEPNGDLLVGKVDRNGIDIATATTCFKQTPAKPDAREQLAPGSAHNVNLRLFPVEDGLFRRELLTRQFEDVVIHEAWAGPTTVERRRTPRFLFICCRSARSSSGSTEHRRDTAARHRGASVPMSGLTSPRRRLMCGGPRLRCAVLLQRADRCDCWE